MSIFPTPHILGVKRRQTGSVDRRNNPVVTYAAAIDWPVHGIAPGASLMPGEVDRDLSLILWTVYAPAGGNAPDDLDLVVIDGKDYALESTPADWTKGPWGASFAGIVVRLKRAEG